MDMLRRLLPFLALLILPAVAAPADRVIQPSAIEVLSLDTLQRRVVFRSSLRIEAPSFTATGDAICFREDGHLYHLRLDDSAEATEVNADNVTDCAVAAASGMIAPENLPQAGRNGPAWLPRLSPDRSTIAYVWWKGRGDHGRPAAGHYLLRSVPYGGGDVRELARFRGDDGALGTSPWSPDGNRLVFVSRESPVSRKGD